MFWLYFLALIPILAGGALVFFHKEIHWTEWLIGAVLALVTAGIFHFFTYRNLIGDYQVESGQITQVRQFSAWKEAYREAVYRTERYSTGFGKNRRSHTRRVFSHWKNCTRWHPEHWVAYSNISTQYEIDKNHYIKLMGHFGGEKSTPGDRHTSENSSHMIDGDPNDYIANNINGYIEPVNKSVFFENRIKNTRNIFNYGDVSPKTVEKFKLVKYPYHTSPWHSDRLIGTAQTIFTFENWEKLNGELGPVKQINLICIGWDSPSAEVAQKQAAYWKGGKKNDFIIQYGPGWSRVTSWCDSLVKKNVETLFLNPKDPELFLKLRNEIISNYKIVDWHKFDYIGITPTFEQFVWFIIVMMATQVAIYVVFHHTEIEK